MFSGTTEAAALDVPGRHQAYGSIIRAISGLIFIRILRDGPALDLWGITLPGISSLIRIFRPETEI
jgi:hypothetical protein